MPVALSEWLSDLPWISTADRENSGPNRLHTPETTRVKRQVTDLWTYHTVAVSHATDHRKLPLVLNQMPSLVEHSIHTEADLTEHLYFYAHHCPQMSPSGDPGLAERSGGRHYLCSDIPDHQWNLVGAAGSLGKEESEREHGSGRPRSVRVTSRLVLKNQVRRDFSWGLDGKPTPTLHPTPTLSLPGPRRG